MRRALPGLLLVLPFACLQPVEEGATLSFSQWCDARLDDFSCLPQQACGVADPLAHCADVRANVRGHSDPCPAALRAAIDAGTVRYDGAAAASCRRRLRTQCDAPQADWDCREAFVGTATRGEACCSHLECEAGSWCDGVCRPLLGVGEPARVREACATTVLEATPDGGQACGAPAGAGLACGETMPCADGLVCSDGRCLRPVRAGGACASTSSCAPPSMCLEGTCVPRAQRGERCEPQFHVAAAGDARFSWCQLGLACRAGVCGDALRAGESCREEPNRCGGGTTCDLASFTCRALGGVGAPCASVYDCDLLRCIDGACTEGVEVGGECGANRPCRHGLSCTDGRCLAPQWCR